MNASDGNLENPIDKIFQRNFERSTSTLENGPFEFENATRNAMFIIRMENSDGIYYGSHQFGQFLAGLRHCLFGTYHNL